MAILRLRQQANELVCQSQGFRIVAGDEEFIADRRDLDWGARVGRLMVLGCRLPLGIHDVLARCRGFLFLIFRGDVPRSACERPCQPGHDAGPYRQRGPGCSAHGNTSLGSRVTMRFRCTAPRGSSPWTDD